MIYPWLPRLAQEVSFLQRRSAGFGVGTVQLPGGHPWIKNPRPNTSQHVPTRPNLSIISSQAIQPDPKMFVVSPHRSSRSIISPFSPLRDPLRWKSHGKICATFSVRSCMEARWHRWHRWHSQSCHLISIDCMDVWPNCDLVTYCSCRSESDCLRNVVVFSR